MGPHSFKCGKRSRGARSPHGDTALQWGRTLSSAESGYDLVRFGAYSVASMGPHSFKCGKNKPSTGLSITVSSFNGAALFQVRKAPHQRHHRRESCTPASMGPHSFKCGKAARMESSASSRKTLQWGRTLSSAERNRALESCDGQGSGFNGAALFQVRKAESVRS